MKHLILKMVYNKPDGPTDEEITSVLLDACKLSGAKICGYLTHMYQPYGFSVVALLAESHASVHTWPETGEVYIDYFSCANEPNMEIFERVWGENGFETIHLQEIDR